MPVQGLLLVPLAPQTASRNSVGADCVVKQAHWLTGLLPCQQIEIPLRAGNTPDPYAKSTWRHATEAQAQHSASGRTMRPSLGQNEGAQ
jgi:hypothetical protein